MGFDDAALGEQRAYVARDPTAFAIGEQAAAHDVARLGSGGQRALDHVERALFRPAALRSRGADDTSLAGCAIVAGLGSERRPPTVETGTGAGCVGAAGASVWVSADPRRSATLASSACRRLYSRISASRKPSTRLSSS